MLNYCLNAIKSESLPEVEYKGGGILPSEMLAFISLCRAQNVSRVVESGRSLGYSTEVLAESGFTVHSIERVPDAKADERFSGYKNLRLYKDSASKQLPKLVKGRCAVLLDGPKGDAALSLWKQVQEQCVLCGIHDASKKAWSPGGGHRNLARQHIENAGAWFTDDEEYIKATEHLDKSAWQGTYSSRGEMTAYGFTLAILKGGLWRD